jgi:hypothetical protein
MAHRFISVGQSLHIGIPLPLKLVQRPRNEAVYWIAGMEELNDGQIRATVNQRQHIARAKPDVE